MIILENGLYDSLFADIRYVPKSYLNNQLQVNLLPLMLYKNKVLSAHRIP
jgi:hypothetical protein